MDTQSGGRQADAGEAGVEPAGAEQAGAEQALADYLDLMDTQRERMFSRLENLAPAALWRRPAPGEWSIGEVIDHQRAVYASFLVFFRLSWALLWPWAQIRRRKRCQVMIDDVYHRPNFPHGVGWIWPPRYTPQRPAALAVLRAGLTKVHHQARDFYAGKPPDLLGQVPLYDPAIGCLNLIQALRVGVYHDQLHAGQIDRLLDG